MRLVIPSCLPASKAKRIATTLGLRDLYEEDIQPLTDIALSATKSSTRHPAYCEVQRQAQGHEWHCDTGNNDHMKWCTHTATVLLSPPEDYQGGGFYFEGDEQPADSYLSMLIYSSNQMHRVLPHRGDRRVLLMFLS